MGYTHYFPGLTATTGVIDDARKIIDNTSVTVCGPKGQGLPILDEAEGIRLNGFRAAGEACETFHLRGTKEPHYPDMWTFCKTEQLPYDEVVEPNAVRLREPTLDLGLLRQNDCRAGQQRHH